MASAFQTAEKSRSRAPGRASSQAPSVTRQAAFASRDMLRLEAGRCACGGSCPRCQAKSSLRIGAPDDAYEREADAVADRVMRMAGGAGPIAPAAALVQRKCGACNAQDDEGPLQPGTDSSATAAHGAHSIAPSSVGTALNSPGRPLDDGTRAFFEARFGHDFSAVRVHSDPTAQGSAQEVNATAFTVGRDIVFGTGRYAPGTHEGRRLLAHELTHVVQQSDARMAPAVQRQTAPPPPCPASIALSSGKHAVHVPACGTTPVRASHRPASAPVTYALANGATQPTFPGVATTVAPGTTISNAAGTEGTITVAPGQTPGYVAVLAAGAAGCTAPANGFAVRIAQLNFASTPTGVGLTSVIGPLASSATSYGAQFQETLNSASGNSAHLSMVHVNEHFAGLATPDATTHVVPTPFGNFTLNTNAWLPNSDAPGWDITASGIMGPDNLAIDRSFIDVGQFVSSASNPTPANTLTDATPVGFTVQQDLHWFCPQAAVGSQWIVPPFATLTHTRHLWMSTGNLTFITGIPAPSLAATSDAYTGQPAIINAAASPNPVLVSATLPPGSPRGTPRPTPNTATVTADTLPVSMAGLTGTHGLGFRIRGAALGCTINATTGVVTVGTTTGTITVRVSDVNRANRNFDEVQLAIVATLPPSSPVPVPPPGPHPGLYPHSVPGEIAPPPPLPVLPS